jgi:hypothetical protein
LIFKLHVASVLIRRFSDQTTRIFLAGLQEDERGKLICITSLAPENR